MTPTIEFNLNGDSGLVSPYYLPLNDSSDIIFKTKIIINNNFNFLNKYKLNTEINYKNSQGNLSIDMYNEKLDKKSSTYSSAEFKAKQVLNRTMFYHLKL